MTLPLLAFFPNQANCLGSAHSSSSSLVSFQGGFTFLSRVVLEGFSAYTGLLNSQIKESSLTPFGSVLIHCWKAPWRKYFHLLSGRAAPAAAGGPGQAYFLPRGGNHRGKAVQHRGARRRVLRTEGLPAVADSGKNGEFGWAAPAAELSFPLRYCTRRDCLTESEVELWRCQEANHVNCLML